MKDDNTYNAIYIKFNSAFDTDFHKWLKKNIIWFYLN